MIALGTLIDGLDLHIARGVLDDVNVLRVTLDSRRVSSSVIFVAARGATENSQDGHSFVENAFALGACAVVVERGREQEICARLPNETRPILFCADPRRVAALLSERCADSPSKKLRVVGVTGTNGKTTTTFVLAQALGAIGRDAAVFGTLGVGRPQKREALGFTTPEAEVVSEKLAALVDDDVGYVAMEVSSHALTTSRAEAVHFCVTAFTNFTQDHLDFHGDMDAYLAAKARLFLELTPEDGVAILPIHLAEVMAATAQTSARVMTWAPNNAGFTTAPDVYASELVAQESGLSFSFHYGDAVAKIHSPLVGKFNVENLLVAGASMLALGIAFDEVVRGLSSAEGVPGRMERVSAKPLVVVDFAHTPDAIARALTSMRALTSGRLIVVFGAGGDRDASKRESMGYAAAELADAVVLTSDNPRTELPQSILRDLEGGVRSAGMTLMRDGRGFTCIEDRAEAIAFALELAGVDDAVLIAGKGDERTQTIGKEVRIFVDRDVVLGLLHRGVEDSEHALVEGRLNGKGGKR